MSSFAEQFRRAEQTRNVRIVSTRMCDAHCLAGLISCGQRRSVRQAGVFPDGERIHVSSRKHGAAFAVSQDADDAGLTDLFDSFVTAFL